MWVCYRHSRADNSVVRDLILPKFKFIQDIMLGLITCKFEIDQASSILEKVETSIFLNAQGYVLVTCKYQKDWIKNNGDKMDLIFTSL